MIRRYLKCFFLVALFLSLICLPAANAENLKPRFNFTDWPADILSKLLDLVPELKKDSFSEDELNDVLKKVSQNMMFSKLAIVERSNELFLVGTIQSTIQTIEMRGLTVFNQDESKEILNLSLIDANNEVKVNLQIEKFLTEYKNKGYRNTKVKYFFETLQTGHRKLIIDFTEGVVSRVTSIQVTGLEPNENSQINKNLFWEYSGAPLTEDLIKKINTALRKKINHFGYFLTPINSPIVQLSSSDEKAKLIYQLQKSQSYKVEIAGQTSYSKTLIYRQLLGLPEFFSTEANIGADLIEKIKTFYIENGFPEVNLTYFENKVGNQIEVTLVINEGIRVNIKSIQFGGSISRPGDFYESRFFELSSATTQDRIFIKKEIEQSAQNLITDLQNDGYISAKLNRVSFSSDPSQPNMIDILITLDEGKQLRLGKTTIEGNKNFEFSKLMTVLGLSNEASLSLNKLEISLQKLKVFYANEGFLEMSIANESDVISYSSDFSTSELTLKIVEGPRIFVGSITLIGNELTHDKLIFTELDFKKGDLFTPVKIGESISRLQKTGHFSSIEITTLEANTPVEVRNVIVKVIERRPGLLTTGIGITNESDYTLHGYTGIAYRNIGGWGRGVSLRAEGSYNPSQLKYLESKVILAYIEPYLFETRSRFRLNFTTSRYVSDINNRKQTIANTTTWSVEQDFTSYITGIWDIYNISNFVDAGISAEDEVKFDYKREDLVIASTGPTIDIDLRDNVLNPQAGSFSRFNLEFSSAALGSNNVDNFFRVNAQTTLYSPVLIRKGVPVFIWANSIRGGYLKDIDSRSQGVPFDKRGFALGGRSSIRGFTTAEIFPSTTPLKLGANYRLLASTSYQLVKSEFRLPLFPKYDVSIGLFYDGGQVTIENVDLGDKWRDSAGIGLRYNTPVGPLNLEYAKKLDRKDGEDEGAFHLSVGVF